MKHSGSCHCGKVKYEVEMEVTTAYSCNCSICRKKGSLLGFAPASNFKLLAGEDEQNDYLFNKQVIHHLFCKTCGVFSFGRTTQPDGTKLAIINVRCLDGFDISKIQILEHDGASK